MFRFLKDKGVTAVVTGEKGEGTLTRNGLEEYVSDAVIVLDNRVINDIATRRMRILKYRGSSHGANEKPFLIDENGFSVLPLSSLKLNATVTDERISTGIPDLDDMLGGKGYFKGSTVLITGQAGTGKTSFGAEFVQEACKKGKRALFITFRRISKPDDSEHEIDRHRPRAVHKEWSAADKRGQTDIVSVSRCISSRCTRW